MLPVCTNTRCGNMNYFELFEIPVRLQLNRSELPRKYFELSKKYHPDYFANDTQEAKMNALEKTALLNKAFRTFQNPDETIRYVLQLKGLLSEGEKYQLPREFLLRVMELNESLGDIKDTGNADKTEAVLTAFENEIYQPVQDSIEQYQDDKVTRQQLLMVKDYYFKKKYLRRVRQQVQEIRKNIL